MGNNPLRAGQLAAKRAARSTGASAAGTWKAQRTTQAVEEALRTAFGRPDTTGTGLAVGFADFHGMPVRTANAIASTITDLARQYPSVASRLDYIGTDQNALGRNLRKEGDVDPNAVLYHNPKMGAAGGSSMMLYASTFARPYAETQAEMARGGERTNPSTGATYRQYASRSIADVVRHEFAHAIVAYAREQQQQNPQAKRAMSTLIGKLDRAVKPAAGMRLLGVSEEERARNQQTLAARGAYKAGLSVYGRTNGDEAFAEAFVHLSRPGGRADARPGTALGDVAAYLDKYGNWLVS